MEMTVKELIEKLKECNEDSKIIIAIGEYAESEDLWIKEQNGYVTIW